MKYVSSDRASCYYRNACLLLLLLVAILLPRYGQPMALSKLPPHAGYHGRLATPCQPFFEGWYLRLTTKAGESFAFIFHVFDPHLRKSQRRGVGMQAITPQGSAIVESTDLYRFQADSHQLILGNSFRGGDVFELTENRAMGRASNDDVVVEFDFDITPQIGWGGGSGSRQYSTAGWLAAFPLFEPHYQVLISKGAALGSISVQTNTKETQQYDFADAAVYLEKNWGGSFPSQWWWIQANDFDSNLCVTSTGGRRRLPLTNQEEEVALVGIHWNGEFLPFSTVDWTVKWGEWLVTGSYEDYTVKLTGTCNESGVPVSCPTIVGVKEIAVETFQGNLRVELYHRGKLVLDETTCNACLETGGLPCDSVAWTGKSAMVEPLKSIVMNHDLEKVGADALQLANLFVDIPGL